MDSLKKAIVLLSGGIDSTTVLAIARSRGFAFYALTVAYGQRHAIELEAAKRVANAIGVIEHKIVSLDLTAFGGSALTTAIDVPKHEKINEISPNIPITYIPARNTILLSLALGWAETISASHIFIGVTAIDYSGYPDCRPEFITAFEQLANVATKAGIEGNRFHIEAPLQHKSKAEIIRTGIDLGVDYGLTHSCYDPDLNGLACGHCDSCLIRKAGFLSAGVPDPTHYQ